MGSQRIKILLREFFDIKQSVMGPLHASDQFIQFQLNRRAVPILGILNEEHHEKGDNGCPRVDDELPRIAKTEHRPCHGPCNDDQDSSHKGNRMTHGIGGPFRKSRKETTAIQGRLSFVQHYRTSSKVWDFVCDTFSKQIELQAAEERVKASTPGPH